MNFLDEIKRENKKKRGEGDCVDEGGLNILSIKSKKQRATHT